MASFEQANRKINELTFSFPELVPVCKTPLYSTYSFLRYSQFQSSVTRLIILTLPIQKILDQLLIMCESVSTCKKSVKSSDTVNFRVLSPDWLNPSLTMLTLKIFNHLLVCVNLHQHAKIPSVNSISSFSRYSQLQIPKTRLLDPFLTMPNQNIFDRLVILENENLCQHAKNLAISLICSRDVVD